MPKQSKSGIKSVSATPQSGFTVLHVLGALAVGVLLFGAYNYLF